MIVNPAKRRYGICEPDDMSGAVDRSRGHMSLNVMVFESTQAIGTMEMTVTTTSGAVDRSRGGIGLNACSSESTQTIQNMTMNLEPVSGVVDRSPSAFASLPPTPRA